MTSNLVGAVTGHDSDDDAADHRRDDFQQAKMIIASTAEGERPAVEEKNVGEQTDKVLQQKCDDTRRQSNECSQQRDQADAELRLRHRSAGRIFNWMAWVYPVGAQGFCEFLHSLFLFLDAAHAGLVASWPASDQLAHRPCQCRNCRAQFVTVIDCEISKNALPTPR